MFNPSNSPERLPGDKILPKPVKLHTSYQNYMREVMRQIKYENQKKRSQMLKENAKYKEIKRHKEVVNR